jgi:L-ascorbate metabolism protein UlaG (beta-lactamase superfamily)
MKVKLIRNATLNLTVASRSYLIDPYLAAKGEGVSYEGTRRSPLVELPQPVDEVVRGIDAVIVSHLHSDHFDEAACGILPDDIRLLCPARDADDIEARGFVNVVPIASSVLDSNVEIELTPGRHGPMEVMTEMGKVSGFIFRADGEPVLYWAGDTILCDEVLQTIKAFQPDVIVVHACGATWKGFGPLVMDEAMVAEVLRFSPKSAVVATHLDVVDHATVNRESLRGFFEKFADLRKRLYIPDDGETLEFHLRQD